MKNLFIALRARIATKVPEVLHMAIFNDQINRLQNIQPEGDYSQDCYAFARPAIFVEFLNPNEVIQLGQGVQMYDPLIIRIHLIHDNFHNGGDMDMDLAIFDLKDKVFKALQKFEPTGSGLLIRTAEEQDYDHGNIYHWIMDFTTTYVDSLAAEPVGSISTVPPTSLNLTLDLDIDNPVVRTGNGI